MSKSIKDYKEAMDSVRISDSFYKRTETMLSELPEVKLEKKRRITPGRVTALLTAAAACAALVFGIKLVLDRQESSDDITLETTGIQVTVTESVTETAAPLIDGTADEPEEYEMDAGEPEEYDEEPPEAAEPAPGQTTAAASDTAPAVAETAPKATTTSPAPAEKNPGAAGTVPMLSDISYENVTVEITPYFDMGNIKSGENPVKKSGTDCRDIIEFIADITEKSHEMSGYSFTSLFSIRIADENIGLTFYDIYVTDLNAIVITKHDGAGQVRATYGVNETDYEALKHILFLQFGEEDDYELFRSLVSGK